MWYEIELFLPRIAAVPLIMVALGALISPFECSLLVLITSAPVKNNNGHTICFSEKRSSFRNVVLNEF